MGAAEKRLWEAVLRGDAAGVRAAVDAGANVEDRDARGRTPLLCAALEDLVPVAEVLVAAGADPDAQDDQQDSAWLVTGVTGSVAMMRALLPAGPDLTLRNRYGGVSVIPASERGHVDYVRAVLEETDIDVDHVNDLAWTALLEAVVLGDGGGRHERVVELLLAAGATPDLADRDGVTPREHAERRGFDRMARLLREAEAERSRDVGGGRTGGDR